MRKYNKKSFNWYGLKQHFSIRKYHFGAASVLLGMSLALGTGAQAIQAQENLGSSEVTASSTTEDVKSENIEAETIASTSLTIATASSSQISTEEVALTPTETAATTPTEIAGSLSTVVGI